MRRPAKRAARELRECRLTAHLARHRRGLVRRTCCAPLRAAERPRRITDDHEHRTFSSVGDRRSDAAQPKRLAVRLAYVEGERTKVIGGSRDELAPILHGAVGRRKRREIGSDQLPALRAEEADRRVVGVEDLERLRRECECGLFGVAEKLLEYPPVCVANRLCHRGIAARALWMRTSCLTSIYRLFFTPGLGTSGTSRSPHYYRL